MWVVICITLNDDSSLQTADNKSTRSADKDVIAVTKRREAPR